MSGTSCAKDSYGSSLHSELLHHHYHHHHLSCSAKDSYGSSEDSSELLVLPWVRILMAAVSILCTNTYHSCCCVDQSCLRHLCQGFLWQQLHSSWLLVLLWVRILIAAVRILCTTTYHYCCCVEESCLGPGLRRILMAAACIHGCFTDSFRLLCADILWHQPAFMKGRLSLLLR